MFSSHHCLVADTDPMSNSKVREMDPSVKISVIPRAREVGQSYLSSVWTTLRSLVWSVPAVVCARPDMLLVTGPGTCIPVCVLVLVLRVAGVCRGRIVFAESICRVQTLSLSGKILLLFADHVIVQWDSLHKKYPSSTYIGRVVS